MCVVATTYLVEHTKLAWQRTRAQTKLGFLSALILVFGVQQMPQVGARQLPHLVAAYACPCLYAQRGRLSKSSPNAVKQQLGSEGDAELALPHWLKQRLICLLALRCCTLGVIVLLASLYTFYLLYHCWVFASIWVVIFSAIFSSCQSPMATRKCLGLSARTSTLVYNLSCVCISEKVCMCDFVCLKS